jgi:hypothetical protein
MTKETTEIGDIVEGHGWGGRYIRGSVIGMKKRRATVRGGRSMMTVSYKKLALIQRDPTSRWRKIIAPFVPALREVLAAFDEIETEG